jgi:hypothetical protein
MQASVVRLSPRVREDEGRRGVELLGHIDELVRPAAGIGVQVLCEEHLGERRSELRHVRVRRDDHPVGDPRRAGGKRTRRALDAHDAHAAAAVGIELVVVAERGDEDTVARGRMDEQLALGRGDLAAVERERDDLRHGTLMLSTLPGRQGL